jgi:N-acylglucosamine-6-phosphate 2-epimerase
MEEPLMMSLPRGIVVSCQGPPGTSLDDPHVMVAMAKAAEQAGAIGIRAQGQADIRAIRQATTLPIIGLLKREIEGERRITPSLADAIAVAEAGADMVAVDLTNRPRLDNVTPVVFLKQLVKSVGLPILADVSTVEEGLAAAEEGAAAVLSTLSGYTSYSRQLKSPDLELISELVQAIKVPVLAEGRYRTVQQVEEAFVRGAHAVVIGTAITNSLQITRWFVEGVPSISRTTDFPME